MHAAERAGNVWLDHLQMVEGGARPSIQHAGWMSTTHPLVTG